MLTLFIHCAMAVEANQRENMSSRIQLELNICSSVCEYFDVSEILPVRIKQKETMRILT